MIDITNLNLSILRNMLAALLSRIASGERWTHKTRREYSIITAGIMAHEMKLRDLAA